MPTYRWSGRTKNGQQISATLDAASRDEAMAALQQKGIVVSSVEDVGTPITDDERAHWPAERAMPGDRRLRGPLVRAVLGVLILGAAYLILNIATGAWIDCVQTQNGDSVRCHVEKRMGGFSLFAAEDLQIARSATAEERDIVSQDRKSTTSSTKSRVVLTGPFGTVATEWMGYPYPSSPSVARRLTAFFEHAGQPEFHSRQIELPPAALALLLAILGVLLFLSGLWRLVSPA